MADNRQYKIRSDLRPDVKDPFRIYLNISALARHELKPGTPCLLTTEDGRSFMATAWNPEKQLDGSIVQVSRVFQEMHDLKLSDRVTIEKHEEPIPLADSITIYETSSDAADLEPLLNASTKDQASFLELARSQRFQKLPEISIGMLFEVKKETTKRTFTIANARPVLPYRSIYKISAETVITLSSQEAAKTESCLCTLSLPNKDIGGLGVQLQRLRRLIEAYSDTSKRKRYKIPLPALQGGILLYGRPGTGKSLLLEHIAAAGWQRAFYVKQGELVGRGAGLKATVDLAMKLEPSLIIMDRLESLVGSREERSAAVDTIIEAFDRTKESRVLIVGATSNIREIPEPLRQQATFQHQINVHVPDSKARAEILKILCNESKDQKSDLLDDLASRTHGFVGADLRRLLLEAFDKADERIMRETPTQLTQELDELLLSTGDIPHDRKILIEPTHQDWESALVEIRPSAMNDVFIETPETRWSDIGGYHRIKKELQFAIDLQIRYAEEWAAFQVEPTKGILLYGPPGCSKTLIAKAIATEMGLNFLAVKGAEVLDKYVGESERKLREIFDTARAASPSVIFFDEIDALGASRDGHVPGGLHLLTTMLNELDGIEARKNVFVLAATNRPDVLDAALMRPGRLDRHILIGLPDAEARREILQGKLAKVPFPLDAGADVEWLTAATDGYSGAEVVDVLKEAFYQVMERRMEMETSAPIVLDRKCFEHALGRVKRQITPLMIEGYETWGRSFAKGARAGAGAGAGASSEGSAAPTAQV